MTHRLRTCFFAASAALFAASTAAHAQQILIPETQTWNFLAPMGTLPPRPATLDADPNFETTWYLAESSFLTNYDGPSFTAGTTGDPAILDSADSGPAAGPFAYGGVDSIPTPGKVLTVPNTDNRYAAYFRTNFTVPAGGLIEPSIRISCDDGGFLYLDGVLIATINVAAGVTDTYTSFCADATNTEVVGAGTFTFHLRSTGLQPGASPGDVNVLVSVPTLTEGDHTLAMSVHNNTATSSDLGLLLELSALPPSATTIHAAVSNIVRDFKGTPVNTADDEFSFKVTMTGSNTGGDWTSDNPVTSGPYGTAVTMGPYSAASPAVVTFKSAADPNVTTTISVDPPTAFKTLVDYNQVWKVMNPQANAIPPRPAGGTDDNFESTWFLKENSFVTEYDGPNFGANGVAGSYEAVTGPGPFAVGGVDGIAAGQPVGAVGTTLTLPPTNSRRTSYYRTTFTTTQPMSLVTFDLLCDDGVFIYLDGNLVAQENMPSPPAPGFNALASGARTETLLTTIDMSQPPGVNVITTVAGLTPGDHTLAVALHQVNVTSSDFGLALKMSGIEVAGQAVVEATAGQATRNTSGTPNDPTDDTFSFDVTVNGANAGPSWNSDSVPATGPYGTATTFGPYLVSGGTKTVVFTASNDPAATASVTVAPPGSTLSATVGTAVRDGNGTPLDPRDDTFTFPVTVTGTFVSTTWNSNATPATGSYNAATVLGPFPTSAAAVVTLTDSAAPAATTTITVQPPRYVPVQEVVPYSQVWKVMNPLGGLVPDGPGGPDNDFEATWFLAEDQFTTTYNGPTFGSGGVAGSYEAITGPGPFAVGGVDGIAVGTTVGPVGTAITLPATGSRYTSYYRTTFTNAAPVENLKFDVLCDDGVFIYLDGVLVASDTIAAPDTFTGLATAARTETLITTIDMAAAPGGDVIVSVPTLAAGTHTLAVSLHQSAIDSSDCGLAITLYGGTVTGGNVDTDGDGQTDASEGVAGTSPTDPNDFLHITGITPNGGGADLSFPTKSGKKYQPEVSATVGGGWVAFGGVINGTGGTLTANIPQIPIPNEGKYFLRVRVVP